MPAVESAFINYRDNSSELSGATFYVDSIDAGGANYDAVIASIVAVEAVMDDLTLCNQAGVSYTNKIAADLGDIPASAWAKRELGIRIFFVDDVSGKKGHLTVPGPDLDTLTVVDDVVTLADGDIMAAFVTAFESDALSPEGNALTVTRAVIVGRHN